MPLFYLMLSAISLRWLMFYSIRGFQDGVHCKSMWELEFHKDFKRSINGLKIFNKGNQSKR